MISPSEAGCCIATRCKTIKIMPNMVHWIKSLLLLFSVFSCKFSRLNRFLRVSPICLKEKEFKFASSVPLIPIYYLLLHSTILPYRAWNFGIVKFDITVEGNVEVRNLTAVAETMLLTKRRFWRETTLHPPSDPTPWFVGPTDSWPSGIEFHFPQMIKIIKKIN